MPVTESSRRLNKSLYNIKVLHYAKQGRPFLSKED